MGRSKEAYFDMLEKAEIRKEREKKKRIKFLENLETRKRKELVTNKLIDTLQEPCQTPDDYLKMSSILDVIENSFK